MISASTSSAALPPPPAPAPYADWWRHLYSLIGGGSATCTGASRAAPSTHMHSSCLSVDAVGGGPCAGRPSCPSYVCCSVGRTIPWRTRSASRRRVRADSGGTAGAPPPRSGRPSSRTGSGTGSRRDTGRRFDTAPDTCLRAHGHRSRIRFTAPAFVCHPDSFIPVLGHKATLYWLDGQR